ncbi:MAG: hypothetical protein FWE10_02815 [Rikenellaceae bacterium]|nr:hypothetical protein [Rikenellaceae bacterium]MCL2693094.1 hypothetical protein [Rikenellaceae bacterium]
MKRLLLFCLPLLLFGCSKKRQGDEYGFPQVYSLTSKMYDTDIILRAPDMFLVDSFAVVCCSSTPKDFLQVYSISQGFRHLLSTGRTGRGPLEFLQYPILNTTEGNDIFIQSLNAFELARLRVTGTEDGDVEIKEIWRRRFEFPPELGRMIDNWAWNEPFYPVRLNSGYFAGVQFANNPRFFSLWDDDMNFVRFFGYAPIPEKFEFTSGSRHLQGSLRSHGNRMVHAANLLPYLALYEINDDEPVLKWAKYFLRPVYEVDNENIVLSGSSTFGLTQGLSLGENYIYLAFKDLFLSEYDGRIAERRDSDIIFVFDYDGNRVARLDLDRRIFLSPAVSADERTLYGITETDEGYRFVEFELPKFGK